LLTQDVTCDCRKVRLRLHGDCEAATICHCAECQTAAVVLENRFEHEVAGPGGGTSFAIWRKDRVTCVLGADNLAGHRLFDGTPAQRVIATCCGTPMFIDRKGRPWVGMFADRLPPETRPAPRWRTFCKDLAEGSGADEKLPRYPGYSPPLMFRLWRARMATGFRASHVDFVSRSL